MSIFSKSNPIFKDLNIFVKALCYWKGSTLGTCIPLLLSSFSYCSWPNLSSFAIICSASIFCLFCAYAWMYYSGLLMSDSYHPIGILMIWIISAFLVRIIHLYIYLFYVWICQHDKFSISAPYYQTYEQWYLEALSLIEFHACL